MTEKRFVHYEHKGAEYILEDPNIHLDFIEMLGDCLDEKEIVDRLNELYDENEQLKQRIKSRLHYYRELCNEFDKDDGFTYNIVKRIVEDLEDILK